MGMSLRAYARHRKDRGLPGGSDTAVRKAIQAGRISKLPDGTIDPETADAEWSGSTDRAKVRTDEQYQQGAERARETIEAGETKPVPPAAREAVEEASARPVEEVSGGGAVTYAKARAANEAIKAQMNKLRLQRQQNAVVDRRAAVAHVFELARKERDTWLQLPARKAALMAAELEVDAHSLEQVLDRYIRDHLAELAEIKVEIGKADDA